MIADPRPPADRSLAVPLETGFDRIKAGRRVKIIAGNSITSGRARWVLEQISTRGVDTDVADCDANLALADPAVGGSSHRDFFRTWADRINAPITIDEELDSDPGTARFFVSSENGRRWDVFFEFESTPSARVQRLRVERRLADGLEIRDATPADGPAIAELYRTTPMRAGDVTVTVDIGDDYFATTRLMADSRTLVATEHGQVVGVYGGTVYLGTLRGERIKIALGCHSRIADGKAGGGVWSNMNHRMVDDLMSRADVPLAYVLTGNTAATRLTAAGAWPTPPIRAVIACDPTQGPIGRAATRDDAARIAEILNATHAGQDLYAPRTAGDVVARLERAPDLYSFDDVWVHGGAVLGLGKQIQTRTTESPTGRQTTTRALVLDYGAAPDAEQDLAELLASRGAAAAKARAVTHLSVFTTEAAHLYPLLLDLAETTEVYDLLIPGVTPDDQAAQRGVHVDQVHF